MMDRTTAHQYLRSATADCHARVDAAFGAIDLGSRDGYVAFLKAQARGFLPAEQALDAAGIASLIPDWPQRKRGDLLRADLAALGETFEMEQEALTLDTPAALLGAIYVLEGSRLGGRYLLKALDAALPHAFLGQAQEKGAWRTLLEQLDRTLVGDGDRGMAASAARAVFGLFEKAARAR